MFGSREEEVAKECWLLELRLDFVKAYRKIIRNLLPRETYYLPFLQTTLCPGCSEEPLQWSLPSCLIEFPAATLMMRATPGPILSKSGQQVPEEIWDREHWHSFLKTSYRVSRHCWQWCSDSRWKNNTNTFVFECGSCTIQPFDPSNQPTSISWLYLSSFVPCTTFLPELDRRHFQKLPVQPWHIVDIKLSLIPLLNSKKICIAGSKLKWT